MTRAVCCYAYTVCVSFNKLLLKSDETSVVFFTSTVQTTIVTSHLFSSAWGGGYRLMYVGSIDNIFFLYLILQIGKMTIFFWLTKKQFLINLSSQKLIFEFDCYYIEKHRTTIHTRNLRLNIFSWKLKCLTLIYLFKINTLFLE